MATLIMELDVDQRKAAEIPPDTRQIVTAGPGSGKTEVVAALVDHLIDVEDVEPDEILVLSFSNAAVHAVSRRLREGGHDPVTVRTLDSLAATILRDQGDDDQRHDTFDARIAAAVRRLHRDGWADARSLLHVVADEIQDVVGLRAGLLLEILRSLPPDAGFTLLGDPAQGIYDFQLKGSSGRNADLLLEARKLGDVREVLLSGQYRARTRDAATAARLRHDVLTPNGPAAVGAYHARIVAAGEVADVAVQLPRWSGTTAFLTDDNGEALIVAEALAEHGICASMRRAAQIQLPAPWIARVLGDVEHLSIERDEFLTAVKDADVCYEPAELWRALRTVAGSRGAEVQLAGLVDALRSGRPLPPELQLPETSSVTVSTVHRAKGLEFDNVVLVDFSDRRSSEPFTAEDAVRHRFVAITRARTLIVRADGPPARDVVKDAASGRWIRRGPKRWQTFGFQCGPGDLATDTPPEATSPDARDHLWRMQPGDRLDLALDPFRTTLDLPVYTVSHDGAAVGHTSEQFGRALATRLGSARRRQRGSLPWPRLSGARLEAVITAAGDPGARSGVRGAGLWPAPTMIGMLKVIWKEHEHGG